MMERSERPDALCGLRRYGRSVSSLKYMGRGAAGESERVFPRERGRWEGGDAVGFAALGACHEAGRAARRESL